MVIETRDNNHNIIIIFHPLYLVQDTVDTRDQEASEICTIVLSRLSKDIVKRNYDYAVCTHGHRNLHIAVIAVHKDYNDFDYKL